VPILFSLPNFYGSWLFQLCNNTQHIGLQDNVSDFRLCCRTFTLNPVLRFVYWQMNYHIEHHMFAAVPCYQLGRLHRLIRHDLPPCAHGLVAVWREIAEIQARQEKDPKYQHRAAIPGATA
jgi:fatty acid desaturase